MTNEPVKILLIEDNLGDAVLIEEYLADIGTVEYTLNVVNTLNAGLSALEHHPYDIILLDLTLPDSTGLATLDRVYETKHSVPIIILTGMEVEFGVDAVRKGAQDYLSKNELNSELLHRTLMFTLERYRLEKQNSLHATALGASADAIVITNTHGIIEWVNDAFTVQTGYSFEEAVGQRTSMLNSEHHSPNFYESLWQTILKGQVWIDEIYNRHKDGNIFIVETSITPVTNHNGTIEHFIAIQRDITERKRTQEQLDTLNRIISLATSTLDHRALLFILCRELATILNVDFASAALIDKSGTFATVITEYPEDASVPSVDWKIPVATNSTYQDMIHHKAPISFEDIRHDDRAAPVRSILEARGTVSLLVVPLLAQGRVVGSIGCDSYTPRLFTDDEIELAVNLIQAASHALENSLLHQELAHYNAQLEAMVQQRTAALERTNTQMQTILDNVRDPILLLNTESIIYLANPAFTQTFGYEIDDVIGQSLLRLIDQAYKADLSTAIRALCEGKYIDPIVVTVYDKVGKQLDIEMSLAFVPDEDGQIVCALHDVTHMKAMERIKDEFVAMVNHELRNPIGGIMLASETLLRYSEQLTDEQRKVKTERIQREAQTMKELADAILDLSQVEARQERSTDLVDLCAIVSRVVDEHQGRIQAKKQHLHLNINQPSIIVQGDELDFLRVWRNLVDNAIKYTPTEGTITIYLDTVLIDDEQSADVDELPTALAKAHIPGIKYALGQVHDTGFGMTEADLENLFTRFYRGWAKKSDISGTGLGLSLVREILRQYEGNITVESQKGVGSTFTFWVPCDVT